MLRDKNMNISTSAGLDSLKWTDWNDCYFCEKTLNKKKEEEQTLKRVILKDSNFCIEMCIFNFYVYFTHVFYWKTHIWDDTLKT